jgi:hypothetical protein
VNISRCRFVAAFIALAIIGASDVHSQKHSGGDAPSMKVPFTDITRSAGVNFRQIKHQPQKLPTIGSGGLFFDYTTTDGSTSSG